MFNDLPSPYFRHIGHLQAVGHVAGEAHIEDGSTDALVFHDVHHVAHQRTCLPGKGATRFEDNLQPGVALVQSLKYADEQFYVVVLARHQVSSTKVKPFQLWEPFSKVFLDVHQRTL